MPVAQINSPGLHGVICDTKQAQIPICIEHEIIFATEYRMKLGI